MQVLLQHLQVKNTCKGDNLKIWKFENVQMCKCAIEEETIGQFDNSAIWQWGNRAITNVQIWKCANEEETIGQFDNSAIWQWGSRAITNVQI